MLKRSSNQTKSSENEQFAGIIDQNLAASLSTVAERAKRGCLLMFLTKPRELLMLKEEIASNSNGTTS